MDNKNIFARNLQRHLDRSGKSRKEVCKALGFNYYTFTDWVNGRKYPRMDKVELLAQYFGILKSDLIEEKVTPEKEKDNDILADIIVRMRTDQKFFSVISSLYKMDADQLDSVEQVLQALHAFGK